MDCRAVAREVDTTWKKREKSEERNGVIEKLKQNKMKEGKMENFIYVFSQMWCENFQI